MRGDKFHNGVPTDRHVKGSVSRLPARPHLFRDPKLAAIANVAMACGAVMLADDLSSDTVAPVGIDLVLGRLASFTRGGVASPSSTTQAPTIAAQTITGVTTANPGVVTTSAAHGLTTGQTVLIAGVVTATQANGVWVVTVLSTTTFSIPVNVTGTYASGGTVTPLLTSVEMSGHGTARLDLVCSAESGTSTPTLTVSIYTSFDNGVTDPWRSVASFTGVTAAGTSRKVFTGLDRWIAAFPSITGTTPSFSFTLSGEVV